MTVRIPGNVLRRYRRFSLYNSPYPAHDHGHAIDLYPGSNEGISPVAGVVTDVRTVGCPDRPYATDHDHLVVVDLDDEWCAAAGVEPGTVARILHVDPAIEPGDSVAVGDRLGPMVRSGFFGRWVDNHVHLGFRPPDANPHRASGSLRVAADVAVHPVEWDGHGTVVETGPAHAVLDAPGESAPRDGFAALASDGGVPLDGGLTHYAGGGTLLGVDRSGSAGDPVSLLGERVGTLADDGRTLRWEPVDVLANGRRVTGLSLFATRDAVGVKLVCPATEFVVGEAVSVTIRPSSDPIRLGVG